MTTKGYLSAPNARDIISAALTNLEVMIPKEGMPNCSDLNESCKLHDEQLPQSPTPAMTASHFLTSVMISSSAGAE